MNPPNRVHMNPPFGFIYIYYNYLPIILKSSLLLRIHILKQSFRFIRQKYKKTNGLGCRFITRVHMNPCSGFIIGHVFAFPLPATAPREWRHELSEEGSARPGTPDRWAWMG